MPDEDPPSLLEQRYRRWLRLLPVDYRDRWEEDMVDTFLATALTGEDDEALELAGYAQPPAAEVRSVVGLAVRLRLGAAERAPRPRLWRAAWRRVALLGLMVNAIWVVVAVPGTLWLAGLIPGLPDPNADPVITPPEESLMVTLGRVWQTFSSLAALAWVAAFLLLLHQRRRSAAVLALVAFVPQAWNALHTMILFLDEPSFVVASLVGLAVSALPVLGLLAYVGPVEPVRRRPWLVAAGSGTALLAVLAVVVWQWQPAVLIDPNGLECAAMVVACAIWVTRRRRGVEGDPAWTLALAVVAVALLVERVATIAPFWVVNATQDPFTVKLMYTGLVEVVLVAVAAATFTVAASLDVRRLPATLPVEAPAD